MRKRVRVIGNTTSSLWLNKNALKATYLRLGIISQQKL